MAERPLGGLEFEHEFQSRDFPRLVYSQRFTLCAVRHAA
jgi:hypothetical protein